MSFSKKEILNVSKSMSEVNPQKEEKTNNNYVIVRTYAMGVFAGYLNEKSTETVKILNSVRRIWHWEGASTLSELAEKGTSNPNGCKFPCEVDEIELTSPQGFEILRVTEKAKKSIAGVKVWSQH